MADKTKITIPKGKTEEFQVQLNSLNIHVSVGATTRLVRDAGKETEKVFPGNPNDNEFIQISAQIGSPEQLEKLLKEQPLVAGFLDEIRAKFVEKYS